MTLCRVLAGGFALLWLLALGILAIGTFGWFGQERDPLSAVYLVMLGLPWNRFVDFAGPLAQVLVVLTPGVNLLIIYFICRFVRGGPERKDKEKPWAS